MTIYRLDQKHALKAISQEQFLGYTRGDAPLGALAAYATSVWAWRCVQIRMQTIAGIPVRVTAAGAPLVEHPLAVVFSDEGSDLVARLEAALCIWGTAYLEITRAPLGNARGLRWLNSTAVTPVKTARGIERFTYTPQQGGPGRDFMPEEIVYLHTFNPNDDLGGLGALSVALTSANVDRQIARYAQSFFQNGARIEGILTVPGADNDQIDALEAKWKAVFRGVGKWFKTLIFGAQDAKYVPLSYPPDDLALETLSSETRRNICAAFGVPPVIAGAWEAMSNANAKEQRQSFYTETILPELDFIEDQLNTQFVSRFYPGVSIYFDVSEINALREDELTRNQALTTAVGGGWMTINEARARVSLPPVPGGDALLPAPGTAPISTTGEPGDGLTTGFFRREGGWNYP